MEFVNNAAFLVFIVFLMDSEKEEEPVAAFHARTLTSAWTEQKNNFLCVCFLTSPWSPDPVLTAARRAGGTGGGSGPAR